ncbi:MAG: carbonate dehydratase [Gemmatimonadales bacterium]
MSDSSPPDRELAGLFAQNRAWAAAMTRHQPDFFERLSHQQRPRYCWIGCSDSRVPATEIVGLLPGEMFVHRNVANVVVHTDLNCLSVLQFAVDVLEVDHVIVVGHYGCGGVRAAWEARSLGLIDNWLRHVQDVGSRHLDELNALPEGDERLDRLCELNVVEQAMHVCRTTVVQDAWRRGHGVSVHGWVYSLQDGLLRDLAVTVSSAEEAADRLDRGPRARPSRVAS